MGSPGERSKGQVLAYVAAAVLVAVAGFRYLGGAEDEPASAPVEIEDPASEAGTTGGGGDTRLHVHVAGAVREDGLYTMPSGARVGAAIDRAGGPTAGAELAGVNLAAELQDGQQVVVPRRGEVPVPTAAGTTGSGPTEAAGADAAPISLAQATPEQLDASVEGIGPVLAAAIIEYRDENGSVRSIDQLQEVDGIGEERLATLREALVP